MITIYIKKIQNISEDEKQNIINSLSTSAKERLNKKRNKDLYLASLCALSLLTNEQRENIEYTENGRPFFDKLNQDISISHSKNYVAIAISNSISNFVGIDIEDISDTTPTARFLTSNEKTALENGTPYLEIWTKKEALFKFLKNDSLKFIHLDSATPDIYDAKFTTVEIENSILTICTHTDTKIEIIQK